MKRRRVGTTQLKKKKQVGTRDKINNKKWKMGANKTQERAETTQGKEKQNFKEYSADTNTRSKKPISNSKPQKNRIVSH